MTGVAFEPIVTTAGLTAAARAHVEDRVLRITHVAIGDEAWVPDATATELRGERARVPVESRSLIGDGVWKVTTTITGEADFFAREIGFFADDDGTPVLLFVYAHDEQVFAGVTRGQETEFELQVSLAAVPEGTVEFAFLDASQTIQDLIDDARGRHNLGGDFNFALTRDLKHWKAVAVEELEREAMIWRTTGQSGLTMMRQYAYGGDDAMFRPGAVNFAALGQHDHPNYRMMSGLPELQAAVNGYPVQTRHTDYRWLEAADGRYLANAPAVMPELPAAITNEESVSEQTAMMQDFYKALRYFDPAHFPGFRDHVDVHVSYLEIWFEELLDSETIDTVHSFRHKLDGDTIDAANAYAIAHALTGQKAQRENTSFTPRLVRLSGDRGIPRYAVTRYRVLTKRLGTLSEWPVDDMVDVVDDPATRLRFGQGGEAFASSRQARFRVLHARGDIEIAPRAGPGLIDRMMAQIPGLDGPGAEIAEQSAERPRQVIGGFGESDHNAARYSRWHSYPRGAAGRRNTRRGYNDPMLFVAHAQREEVAHFTRGPHDFRVSYAIPLEIVLAPPHMVWNPYRLPELESRAAVTAGGANGETQATAYAGIYPDRYWLMTPNAFFTGDVRTADPADTTRGATWVRDRRGRPRPVRASGVYVRLKGARLRYPIAPIHHEGSPAHGTALAMREEAGAVQAALTSEIIALQEQARRQDKAIDDLRIRQKAIKDALFREASARPGGEAHRQDEGED